eukprot:Sdes_comp22362_c0_seq1m20840
MEELLKLEQLSVVAKVCNELENHLGISDRVLAEFIISLVEASSSLEDFQKELHKNGAAFAPSFSANLYRVIVTLKSNTLTHEGKKNGSEFEKAENAADAAYERDVFPGLCIKDTNPDQIVVDDAMDQLEALLQFEHKKADNTAPDGSPGADISPSRRGLKKDHSDENGSRETNLGKKSPSSSRSKTHCRSPSPTSSR